VQFSRGLTPVAPGVTEEQVVGLGPRSCRLDLAAVAVQRRDLVRGVGNGRVGRRPPRSRRPDATAATGGSASAPAAGRGWRRVGRGRVRPVRRSAMDGAGGGTAGRAVAPNGRCALHKSTVGTIPDSPVVRTAVAAHRQERTRGRRQLHSPDGATKREANPSRWAEPGQPPKRLAIVGASAICP
jgi:hypothetical protein